MVTGANRGFQNIKPQNPEVEVAAVSSRWTDLARFHLLNDHRGALAVRHDQ